MALINNQDLLYQLGKLAKINTSVDAIPAQLAEKIVPVLNANPFKARVFHTGYNSATGNITLLTTLLDKDYYITELWISQTKDVLCDNIVVALTGALKGKGSEILLAIDSEALIAGNHNAQITLTEPILMERGATISLVGAFAAGDMTKRAGVFGFTVED